MTLEMKRDQESVCKLLRETVGVLCRSGLQFSVGLRVQGLLAVTVDNSDVFVVQFDDLLRPEQVPSQTPKQQQDSNIRQTGPHLHCSPIQFCHSSDSHPATIGRRQLQHHQFLQQPSTAVVPSSNTDDVILIKDEADDDVAYDINYEPPIDHLTRELQTSVSYSDANCTDDANYNVTAVAGSNLFVASVSSDETKMLETGTVNEAVAEWNSSLPDESSNNYSGVPVNSDRTCTLRPHVKQEYRTQPAARQIVIKYRQQKQAAAAAASNGPSFTESSWSRQLHECTYPGCDKFFRHRHDLLRHQTQKHGRAKSRIMAIRTQRYFVHPDAADSQD